MHRKTILIIVISFSLLTLSACQPISQETYNNMLNKEISLMDESYEQHENTNETDKASDTQDSLPSDTVSSVNENLNTAENKISLLVTDWIGWKPIIDANGGLKTSEESIYGKMGIDVTIKVVDDVGKIDTVGDYNSIACSINEYSSFVLDELGVNNLQIAYVPVKSDGWNMMLQQSKDYIASVPNIGLVDGSGAEYLLSEGASLDTYFKSSDFTSINPIIYNNYDDAFEAFKNRELDLVCLNAPFYYSLGNQTDNYEIVWSDGGIPPYDTAVYGVVSFDPELLKNKALVKLFIYGALKAEAEIDKSDYTYIRVSLPSCNTNDERLNKQIANIKFQGYDSNISIINNEYIQSQLISSNEAIQASQVIASSFLRVLHAPMRATPPPASDNNDNEGTMIEAVPLPIYFVGGDPVNFINPKIAKEQMDNFIRYANDDAHKDYKILIEGYIANVKGIDSQSDKDLALGRAKTVYKYFEDSGINKSRLLEPKGINNIKVTEENSALMRKVQVYFIKNNTSG